MQHDSAMSSQPLPAFTLLRFTLVQKNGGLLTQRRESLGAFHDPEAVFLAAKTRAWQALCLLAHPGGDEACAASDEDLQIQDTEWGYDLRRNGQIVDRFWVHDHRPRQPV